MYLGSYFGAVFFTCKHNPKLIWCWGLVPETFWAAFLLLVIFKQDKHKLVCFCVMLHQTYRLPSPLLLFDYVWLPDWYTMSHNVCDMKTFNREASNLLWLCVCLSYLKIPCRFKYVGEKKLCDFVMWMLLRDLIMF